MAQWYTFPDMLLLVDIMLLNFPLLPDPASPAESAELRPRFDSEPAADLPALELLCAIGMLLRSVFLLNTRRHWAGRHRPRIPE
jgi:hypothetical protein